MKKAVVIVMFSVMLFALACTQKEKGDTASSDGYMDDHPNTNTQETDVHSGGQGDTSIENDNWTAGGYWPTEGRFWMDKDGTITEFDDGKSYVVIPARINGVPVKAIGNTVFLEKGLTDVTLPAGLQSIGARAFAENQLTSITIPEGVSFIGDGAFEGNPLTSVTIPARAFVDYSAFSSTGDDPTIFVLGDDIHFQTSIFGKIVYYEYLCNNRKAGTYTDMAYTSQKEGDFEFVKTRYGTIITDHIGGKVDRLVIPRQLGGMAVKGIIHEAFYNKDISSIQLPDGLTFIGGVNAFSSNKLTSITIPDSVIYVGDYAFSDNQLDSVVIGNNVSSINHGAFFNNLLTNITIPDSVNYIGHGAFEKNQLTSVIIGNGVTSIAGDAFLNNQLTSVTILSSVVSIGSRAFHGNTLTSITIGNDVTLTDGDFPSFDNSFNGVYHDNRKRAGTYLYSASDYYWSMAVPPVHNDDDFEIDGEETFRNYPGIITKYTGSDIWITIPSQIGGIPIKGIGPGAFDKKNLRSVTIPDSVIYIGWGAFQDNKLMSVIIPDSVTDIGEEAFRNNYLKSITIGGDLYLPDGIHFQAFSQSFINFYRDNGRKAGTYVVVEGKGWEYVNEE